MNKEGKIHLIVSDLDDTLLKGDHTISGRSRRAVRRATEAGAVFALASGRMYLSMLPYARMLGVSSPLIACNGADVVDPAAGSRVATQYLSVEVAREAAALARELGAYVQVYYDQGYIFEKDCEYSENYALSSGVTGRAAGAPVEEAISAPTPKLLLFDWDEQKIQSWLGLLRQRFEGRISAVTSKPYYIELTHPGATKGAGVSLLAGHVGVPLQNTAAFGDGQNDLSMLLAVGHGVAMGNAQPHIQKQAAYIAAGNEEDGVARMIEAWLDLGMIGKGEEG